MSHKPCNFEQYVQYLTQDLGRNLRGTPSHYRDALNSHTGMRLWRELYRLCVQLAELDFRRGP